MTYRPAHILYFQREMICRPAGMEHDVPQLDILCWAQVGPLASCLLVSFRAHVHARVPVPMAAGHMVHLCWASLLLLVFAKPFLRWMRGT